ncbi:AbrB family transcriptional regulator [Methylobacterium sp. Leaf456]|uniref:AbrB/MazE/SpoVT family DNA-binding domain-containing protein n=1 Tax=Methylobacterium sp. Leaf456 TaxID=1736382 RepID=UPI0006F35E9C|nr:hypothetical protein [Methylobacterium sp. Leaf456]KQT49954.1 AbrB family transcriptional regulator [Methylobacterium sp. Leaf456]
MKLEVQQIGDSLGVILPDDLVGRLKLDQGASLYATVNADGSLDLTPHDPTFGKGMKIAEKAMDTYRVALTELKK